MTRIYPEHLPVIPDEPAAENFRVIDVDKTRGRGVLVLTAYKAGEVLFRMNGTLTKEMTQFTLQMDELWHLDDPDFAGRVLHSCDPNSRLDPTTRLFTAVKDIEPGDLLTMDYDETEDVLYRPFPCSCGAENCRGYIAGRAVDVSADTEVQLVNMVG
ncbi:SET domain-containing protein-lysine N-methyltransferase [Aeoliella mucimassa]|uniref:Post-SET domain-containing protein n=1 Tax=Aeoliella mucimassa TaxID=2527972 RepID=A0A518ARI7_9BACT|nr:SET domain-containing protein-lysine N-methyltransferase [Aeoliella mucimassa]QDU57337.1 hypothetical protein Pan181_35520 [Aeoliella mucimassa]